MFLIHFNPINLILKFAIVNFDNFTEKTRQIKEYINNQTNDYGEYTQKT